MSATAAAASAVIGLGAGAFVPVLTKLTPMRRRLLLPHWHCGNCGVKAPGQSMVPVLSWATGTRHCSTCGHELWSRSVLQPLLCALAFALTGAAIGWSAELAAYLVFAFAAVTLSITDFAHQLIPNRVLYPCLGLGVVALAGAAIATGDYGSLLSALVGMTGAFLFFFVVWFVNPRGIGFGDVRLALLVGLFCGWVSIANVLLGIFVGLVFGAVAGLVMMAMRRLGRRDAFAYGPFLIGGAVASIFFGPTLGSAAGL